MQNKLSFLSFGHKIVVLLSNENVKNDFQESGYP